MVLADDALALIDETDEQVKYLRLDRYGCPVAQKLTTAGIEAKAVEVIEHEPLAPDPSNGFTRPCASPPRPEVSQSNSKKIQRCRKSLAKACSRRPCHA